jgi:hypothetical protein
VTTGLDISKTSGALNRSSGQLVHVIDTYDPFVPANLFTKGKPPSSLCVEIWTTSKPGDAPPNYEVCATPDATGQGWKAAVARTRDKGAQVRVADATVQQPSPTRLVLRFAPDSIRKPASYRWRAETTSFASDCQNAAGCQDFAPDRPDTAQTVLSKSKG